jgi:hypothetical protein
VAYYRLNVPAQAQVSSNTCWHTAALMIWHYSQHQTGRSGPINSFRADFAADRPINDWAGLAKLVGLREVGSDTAYTSEEIKALLLAHGPLWAAGNWFGLGHCIVVTGIDSEIVYFNDPDGGVKKTELLSWFNTKRFRAWPDSLLAKDPSRY